MGYGRSESRNGGVFPWNFSLVGSYWTAADVAVQHIAKEWGGFDKLKGKKISLVYHDSPYGKEPIAALEARAKQHGFDVQGDPGHASGRRAEVAVAADPPGPPRLRAAVGLGRDELRLRSRKRPASAIPRDKMIGVWWSGAEPDVIARRRSVDRLQGADAAARRWQVHAFMRTSRSTSSPRARRQGKTDDIGQVLYNRGLLNSMLGTEAIRTAQKKFGNKPMTGEQVRWGFENLDLTAARIKELGFEGMVAPIKLVVHRTTRARTGPRPAVGRQGVEDDLGLLHGRPQDP